MTEAIYDGSLDGLFAVLDGVCRGGPLPDRVRQARNGAGNRGELAHPAEEGGQGDLFGTEAAGASPALPGESPQDGAAQELSGFSMNAYNDFIHGWMSEFPIAADLIRFAWKVIAAGRAGGRGREGGAGSPEARRAAEQAASDRGDPAVAEVRGAAYKVIREIDRLQGLLRFAPDYRQVYTARCAPDHFVLPALAGHFSRRFGDIPWIILDEKRGIAVGCPSGGAPRLMPALPALPSPAGAAPEGSGPEELLQGKKGRDPWETMWQNYHRVINNESRRNPALQRQFMPVRYWKYMNEV
jgi:hypothetical protein